MKLEQRIAPSTRELEKIVDLRCPPQLTLPDGPVCIPMSLQYSPDELHLVVCRGRMILECFFARGIEGRGFFFFPFVLFFPLAALTLSSFRILLKLGKRSFSLASTGSPALVLRERGVVLDEEVRMDGMPGRWVDAIGRLW
ncbi:hypothetical protein IE53DRAFT_110395 [Violaceomyces palustris]|uniref:Uncharacterized protein n=1 Tax=Violaceomyces palustris TaxID=1673888 RepID=A0ACD0NWC5_9BASI|nr:hypothetical protein IE53DRAFT_110395 [Violaceomyces palustris]